MHLPRISRKNAYKGLFLACLIGSGLILYNVHTASRINSNRLQNNAGIAMSGAAVTYTDQNFAEISKLGFTWIRLDINWLSVQPKNTKYEWSAYDKAIANAERHHLKVLVTLDYAPLWAAQGGCANVAGCAPKDPAKFAAFTAQVAKRYRHSVNNWEIWNEENIDQFWSPAPNAEQYAAVLKQSYKAIKTENPDATVILGGMSSGDNPKVAQIDAVAFLRAVYKAGAKGSFDAVAYHPYTYPQKPSRFNAWNKLTNLHSVMQAQGEGAKQIWITEYGAPTNGPKGSKFVSETTQASMARAAFSKARSKPWVGPFFWYTYKDKSAKTSTVENFFGIRKSNGSTKPAYDVWQEMLSGRPNESP